MIGGRVGGDGSVGGSVGGGADVSVAGGTGVLVGGGMGVDVRVEVGIAVLDGWNSVPAVEMIGTWEAVGVEDGVRVIVGVSVAVMVELAVNVGAVSVGKGPRSASAVSPSAVRVLAALSFESRGFESLNRME